MTENNTKSNNKYFCIDCHKYTKPLRKNRCDACYKRYKQHKLPKKKCECDPDCKEMIYIKTTRGKPNNFAIGHHMKMENHYNWKGGRYIGNYIFLRIKGKWIREHRVIYEQYHNVCLLPWIEIHHINGDKHDNRIENLQPMTINDHRRLESLKRWKSVISLYTS